MQIAGGLHIADMKVGKAVRYVRDQKGISQNQMARESGHQRAYLYRLENDLLAPTTRTLKKICAYLDISITELTAIAEQIENGSISLPENDGEAQA